MEAAEKIDFEGVGAPTLPESLKAVDDTAAGVEGRGLAAAAAAAGGSGGEVGGREHPPPL